MRSSRPTPQTIKHRYPFAPLILPRRSLFLQTRIEASTSRRKTLEFESLVIGIREVAWRVKVWFWVIDLESSPRLQPARGQDHRRRIESANQRHQRDQKAETRRELTQHHRRIGQCIHHEVGSSHLDRNSFINGYPFIGFRGCSSC